MIILGIDPGTHRIGYGAIESIGTSLTLIECGLLPVSSSPHRLTSIEQAMDALLARLRPDRVGLEKLFVTHNQKTAIAVAQARGVLLNTVTKKGIPFVELSPSEIKLAVTGDGRAEKRAVAYMAFRFLKMPEQKLVDDVTDALAIAIAASTQRIDI